jgi:PAS domain S-box-containing protein
MLHIKHWLAPPVFPDDEIKTRRANLLNSALINISTLVPMLFIGDLLGGKSHLPSFLAEVLAFAFCLVLRSWMHRGRVRLASVGLITMGLVLITAVVASKGTVRVPTTAMYMLVVITAGLLFDLRGMMITTALCSLLIGGLIGAENAGLLPRPDYSVTITQWVAYTVIFAWTGSLTFSSLQAMLRALTRADKEITDRKRAEEALKESNDYIETIIKTSVEGIFVIDKGGKFEYGNAAFSKILGWPMDELIGESFIKVIPDDMHEFIRMRWEEIQQGISNLHEIAIVTKNGSRRDLFVSHNKVKIKGEVKYIFVIKDATEQKLAEKKIADSLAEKEILLREIHHRVKNNMQIISSLLGLQSGNIKEQKYSEIFKDSQNRINSISLTHEKLYRSKDFANIDFDEYIRDLTTNLFHSYRVGDRIELILNIDNVTLGIDQGIPCGLIINELITNSLKYAFPKDRKGEIKISLRRRDENLIELVVGDNGVGIPDDMDFRKTESLGLRLVTILVEDQLHGQIDLDRSRGTEFKIRFRGVK